MKTKNREDQNSEFNRQRRDLLKTLVASSGVVLVPGLAMPECRDHTNSPARIDLNTDSIAVEFSDPESNCVDGVLARVSIHNNSEHEIRLSHLSTGSVTTQHGVYDINSRLHRSPVAVGPSGVYHFWLKPIDAAALPANTFPAPALSTTAKTKALQLRVV